MRRSLAAATAAVCLAAIAAPIPALAGDRDHTDHHIPRIARQTLPDNDGWAAAGAGTTGGSAATRDQVHVVDDRAGLVAALGGDNATNGDNATPKIIVVRGEIDGFEDEQGDPIDCADLADPEYSLDEYLAAYDPEIWGWDREPSGPLEDARDRSRDNQQEQTVINVGPNTTIVGARGATLTGMTLMLDGADNVIVRNLELEDARDCFPQWDPTDGSAGNWNSDWDIMSVRRSSNVWVDHNSFSDGDNPDGDLPVYFGRTWQVHDGALDITHNADLVTVSYNEFTNHDKTMLIGSTNNPGGGDPGLLNVTLHHNRFDGVVQRAPRIRFGHIDAYNNYYRVPETYGYSWGIGVESALYAENNYFELGPDVPLHTTVADWGGAGMTEIGTWARYEGRPYPRPTSVLDAYNAANDPDLGDDSGWTPQLRNGRVLHSLAVPAVVRAFAGAGRLH